MNGSSFPKMQGKHNFSALVNPGKIMKGMGAKPKGITNAIFVYSDKIFSRLVRNLELKKINAPYYGYLKTYESRKRRLFVIKLGIGAPLTAATAEELYYWGIRNFYIMGSAGSLNRRVPFNSLVVCNKAVRDEGTSHHYAKASLYAYPSGELVSRLKKTLDDLDISYRVGPTWTIDAPYMETTKEARHYKKIGVLTVEMEASALFVVAKKLGAKACALFSVSDILDEEWTGFSPTRIAGYNSLVKVADKLFPEP